MQSKQRKIFLKDKYRIGRPLSLFILCSLPIFFQFLCTQQNLELSYPPIVHVCMSVFGLIVATTSVSSSKRSDSALLSHKHWLEQASKTVMTISLLILAYVFTGLIPAASNKIDELGIGLFYIINIFNLFFAEFIVTLPNFENDLNNDIDPAILANSNLYAALQWSTIPVLLGVIITFCIYFLFRYDPTIPNHLTVFASATGVLLAIAGKINE